MAGDEPTDGLETTFSLVANDIRLDILRTLWDSYTADPVPEPDPVSFSTLKDRVGVRDSGQFHYHLDELVPEFVTNHEAGYLLTHAGAQIVGAAVSGVYSDRDATIDTREIGDCPTCEGTFELRYERGRAVVDCDTCGETRIMAAPPILAVEHDVDESPELFGIYTLTQLQQTARGFCYLCRGPVEGTVSDSSLDGKSDPSAGVEVAYVCTACGAPFYTTATTAVLDHPAVVSLLHDAGIDYREIPSWGLGRELDFDERLRDDPVRVEVTVSVDGDDLTLVLDETLDVIEHTRA